MPKAVQFDDYGGIEVLEVRDVPRPEPGPDQVLVAVRAAGINIGEAKIRAGLVRDIFPATEGWGGHYVTATEITQGFPLEPYRLVWRVEKDE